MADLVTTAEVTSYLTIEHTDDNTLISELIDYVTAMVEIYTGRSFTQSTRTDELVDGGGQDLSLRYVPVASITSVKDSFDSDAVIAAADYILDADAGLIYPSEDITSLLAFISNGSGGLFWGVGRGRWKVTYVAGHNGAPDDVKGAALSWIADIYTSPDSLKSEKLGDRAISRDDGIPSRVKLILDKYCVPVF